MTIPNDEFFDSADELLESLFGGLYDQSTDYTHTDPLFDEIEVGIDVNLYKVVPTDDQHDEIKDLVSKYITKIQLDVAEILGIEEC